jgi:hypothetical protein
MGLERQNDDIDFTGRFRIVSCFRVDLKIADLAADTHAMLLHGAQVRTPGYQRYVFTRAGQHGAEKCADCSRAYNRESHDDGSVSGRADQPPRHKDTKTDKKSSHCRICFYHLRVLVTLW